MHRFPTHKMCWIFPGTSICLNLAGRSGARWGMWRSPIARTSTILLQRKRPNQTSIIFKIWKVESPQRSIYDYHLNQDHIKFSFADGLQCNNKQKIQTSENHHKAKNATKIEPKREKGKYDQEREKRTPVVAIKKKGFGESLRIDSSFFSRSMERTRGTTPGDLGIDDYPREEHRGRIQSKRPRRRSGCPFRGSIGMWGFDLYVPSDPFNSSIKTKGKTYLPRAHPDRPKTNRSVSLYRYRNLIQVSPNLTNYDLIWFNKSY